MNFPDIVKTVREQLNMSQEDLAREIDVSFATINRWENDKTHPNKLTQKVFFEFCKTKGIDVDRFA